MTPRLTPSITEYIPMPSPVGELLLTAKGDSLSGIWFAEHKGGTPLRPDWRRNNASAVLGQARIELAEYFAGTRHRFEIKLRPEGTDFQRVVWDALLKVQFGKTSTYGALAAQVGRPSAGRAVGAAVGANPIAIIVPCHRIIGRDGSLSGYAGGLERKVRLLAIEGIALPAGGMTMSALRFMALPNADGRAYQRGEIDANGKCANGRCLMATVSQAVIASPRLPLANRGWGTSTASRCMNSGQGCRLVNP